MAILEETLFNEDPQLAGSEMKYEIMKNLLVIKTLVAELKLDILIWDMTKKLNKAFKVLEDAELEHET